MIRKRWNRTLKEEAQKAFTNCVRACSLNAKLMNIQMHSSSQAASQRIHQGARGEWSWRAECWCESKCQDANRGAEFNGVEDQRVLWRKTWWWRAESYSDWQVHHHIKACRGQQLKKKTGPQSGRKHWFIVSMHVILDCAKWQKWQVVGTRLAPDAVIL